MQRYKFPLMLGPASAHPEGTREWAECLGNELDYHAERAEDGIDDLIQLVLRVAEAKIPPWSVWPEPPCRSMDVYFQLCTGLTFDQIRVLIITIKRDDALGRRLDNLVGISRVNRATRLCSEWKQASPEEREEFLAFLKLQDK